MQLLVSGLPADIPRVEEISVDRWVLGFTLGMSVFTGLGFGPIPAIQTSRSDVQTSLKVEDRGSTASFGRAAGLFVIGEIAVAVLLVIGAGLLIRSFTGLLRVDPGFRFERLVTARITPPDSRYRADASTRAFYRSAARADRGASRRAVRRSGQPSAAGGRHRRLRVRSGRHALRPGNGRADDGRAHGHAGVPGTMGIPLLEGPGAGGDRSRELAGVAVVNETMAREHLPGEDPIGKPLKGVWRNDWITVVGVVGDVKHEGLANRIEPEIYRPFPQVPAGNMSLVVRRP